MIDAYLWGNVERISPEAPVPIVSCNKKEDRLGGAANVALNIASLGAKPLLCSVVGNDDKANTVFNLLDEQKMSKIGIIIDSNRKTTVKSRIISSGQHLLRVDEEITDNLSNETEKLFIEKIHFIIENQNINAIIFEDYDKGVITKNLIKSIVDFANEKKIPILVDPKKRNFEYYKNVTLIKPNFKELIEGLKLNIEKTDILGISKVCKEFAKISGNKFIMPTLSEAGIFISDTEKWVHISAQKRDIVDVSGAGDTVIAVASLALASNFLPDEIAAFANIAGGLVCEKVGVVPINIEEFKIELINYFEI